MVRAPFRTSGTPLDGLVLLPGPSGRYMKRAVRAMPCWAGLPNGVLCHSTGWSAIAGDQLSVLSGADISRGQHEIVRRNPYRRNNMHSQRAQLSLRIDCHTTNWITLHPSPCPSKKKSLAATRRLCV
jgi:hypothetical protein